MISRALGLSVYIQAIWELTCFLEMIVQSNPSFVLFARCSENGGKQTYRWVSIRQADSNIRIKTIIQRLLSASCCFYCFHFFMIIVKQREKNKQEEIMKRTKWGKRENKEGTVYHGTGVVLLLLCMANKRKTYSSKSSAMAPLLFPFTSPYALKKKIIMEKHTLSTFYFIFCWLLFIFDCRHRSQMWYRAWAAYIIDNAVGSLHGVIIISAGTSSSVLDRHALLDSAYTAH